MRKRNVCRPSVRRQIRYSGIIAEHEQRKAVATGKARAVAQMETMECPDRRDPLEIARAANAALKGESA